MKGLPTPVSLSRYFLDKRWISCLLYLFVIFLLWISSNAWTESPVNDLSIGFLDNLSYESNERTRNWLIVDHQAVCTNYARSTIYSIP